MRMTRALAVLAGLGLLCGSAWAQPQFRYERCTDLGGGIYAHDYVLDNTQGTVPIYDIETDFQYAYGWIWVETPEDWYYYAGPMSRFETQEAPANVGYEIVGYKIEAGTPVAGGGSVSFTDVTDQVVWRGTTEWPLPEPATLGLLTAGALALTARKRR